MDVKYPLPTLYFIFLVSPRLTRRLRWYIHVHQVVNFIFLGDNESQSASCQTVIDHDRHEPFLFWMCPVFTLGESSLLRARRLQVGNFFASYISSARLIQIHRSTE